MDLNYEFSDETDDVLCEVCGGRSDVAIRPIMFKGFSCRHCFYVWYEYGYTDPLKVSADSLLRQDYLRRQVSASTVTTGKT